MLCLPLVGFIEHQRTCRPASTVQTFPLSMDLDLHAPLIMMAEIGIELAAVLPNRPEVFNRAAADEAPSCDLLRRRVDGHRFRAASPWEPDAVIVVIEAAFQAPSLPQRVHDRLSDE
jgi:hypothetical protein